MDNQAKIEAQGDIFKFHTLKDDERTLFIINKMKEFDKRFGDIKRSTEYKMEYFTALSKELERINE